MIRIILSILFLGALLWKWDFTDYPSHSTDNISMEQHLESEAKQYMNPMIYVLKEANHYADISTRSENFSHTQFIRRYRPTIGNSSEQSKITQNTTSNHLFKSSIKLSQSYMALLQTGGYYIYALRKIIV